MSRVDHYWDVILFLLFTVLISCKKEPVIQPETVKKHLYTLSSDDMEGRKTGTPGIEKAAKYIENEFKRIGLTTFEDLDSYRQTFNFTPRRSKEEITSANNICIVKILLCSNRLDIFFLRLLSGIWSTIN